MDCPFSDDLLFSRTLNTVWRWIVGSADGWSFMKMVKSSTRRNRNMDLTTAPSLQWDAFWLIGWINYNHWHHRCNMIKGTTFQVSSPFGSIVYTYLIFDTTFRTGGGVLFQIGVLFLQRECEWWPILAPLGPVWLLCCKFPHFWWVSFTDLRSVVVYRNWQISGMSRYHSQRSNDLPSIFCGNIDWTYFVIQLVTSNLVVVGTALAWKHARTSQARQEQSARKTAIVEMLLWFHKILLNLLFCIGNLCSLLESDSWF